MSQRSNGRSLALGPAFTAGPLLAGLGVVRRSPGLLALGGLAFAVELLPSRRRRLTDRLLRDRRAPATSGA